MIKDKIKLSNFKKQQLNNLYNSILHYINKIINNWIQKEYNLLVFLVYILKEIRIVKNNIFLLFSK